MNILEQLTPKGILMRTIADKLDGTGITKITIIFCMDTDKYNVMLSTDEGKNMKVDITFDEITTIKKIFINRIVSKWKDKKKEEPKSVIVQVDVPEQDLKIFIQNKNNNVLKFDYL